MRSHFLVLKFLNDITSSADIISFKCVSSSVSRSRIVSSFFFSRVGKEIVPRLDLMRLVAIRLRAGIISEYVDFVEETNLYWISSTSTHLRVPLSSCSVEGTCHRRGLNHELVVVAELLLSQIGRLICGYNDLLTTMSIFFATYGLVLLTLKRRYIFVLDARGLHDIGTSCRRVVLSCSSACIVRFTRHSWRYILYSYEFVVKSTFARLENVRYYNDDEYTSVW